MKVYSNCLIVRSNWLFVCTQSSALGGRWMKGYVGISRGRQHVCVRISQIGSSPGRKFYV
eukprot:scaffold42566_cov60-Cyclotella_meneghiniana.AAC.3